MDEKPKRWWSAAGVGTIASLLLLGGLAAIPEKRIRERHAMLNRLPDVAYVIMKSEHTILTPGVEPTTLQKGGRLPLGLELFGESPVQLIAFRKHPPPAEMLRSAKALFPEAEIWTLER